MTTKFCRGYHALLMATSRFVRHNPWGGQTDQKGSSNRFDTRLLPHPVRILEAPIGTEPNVEIRWTTE